MMYKQSQTLKAIATHINTIGYQTSPSMLESPLSPNSTNTPNHPHHTLLQTFQCNREPPLMPSHTTQPPSPQSPTSSSTTLNIAIHHMSPKIMPLFHSHKINTSMSCKQHLTNINHQKQAIKMLETPCLSVLVRLRSIQQLVFNVWDFKLKSNQLGINQTKIPDATISKLGNVYFMRQIFN